jgi:cyclopropane fatty-acyl-phospholipid synthase-like methyltransferase
MKHPSNSKEFWDKRFSDIDFDYKSNIGNNILSIVNLLMKFNVSNVLDLGCGVGRISIAMARAGFFVHAVDISAEAIEIVRKWADEQSLPIETECSPTFEFCLPKESIDAVVCHSVLDHMPLEEAKQTMTNVEMFLRQSGVMFITFDGLEEDEDENQYEKLSDGSRKYISGFYEGMLWRFYTNDEIKKLCENFDIMEFKVLENGKREVWLRKK